MKKAVTEEEALVAQRAAEWVERLKQPLSFEERLEFVRWTRQSALHVREVLLAITWDQALNGIDPDRTIDIDALAAKAATNVVRVRSESEA